MLGTKFRPSITVLGLAHGMIGKIHTKMLVILLLEDEDEWLNPDISELERLLPLLKQFPDNTMEAYPLSYTVNIPKSDSPELITIQSWGLTPY
jgi:putative SOS response-associated peptidase YedK